MSGFSDTSLWYNYDQTTYVTTGPVANAFKVPQPLGGATPWPTSEIVVETWDGTTFRTLPNSEWQIQGGYLYVYPSTISVWPPTSYRFVVWRRVPSQQTYTGADALALQPAALSAAMDIVGRMAQEALEAANRSLQIHVLDTLNDAFTGKNLHPSKLTLPPIATRTGKVIGFDSLGNIGYFTNSSAGGTSTPDAGALVQRDGAGRSQFVNPATGADAATKDYVDNYASVGLWNNAKTYALNEVVQRNGVLVKSQQAANTGNDPAADTTGTWWTPAGGGSAIVDFYTAGATITAGQWVREGTSGIVPAAAGPSAAASAVIGIAMTSGAGGATIKVHKFGIAKGVTTGRTAGDSLYLSTSSGAHTVDQSSLGYGVNQVRVGIAVSATDIFVCPDILGQSQGYVYNPSGRYGLSGWNVYLDSNGVATPVDGIGGAPVITLASNSSSPLDVASDLLLTKGGATTRQGQGISFDFAIDRGDTGAPINVQFAYKTSANYASGDIVVFLYDVTNSVLVPLTHTSLPLTNGGVGRFQTMFLASSGTAYRLIFHIASSSGLNYTVNVAKVEALPYAPTFGAAIGPEMPWTPSLTSTSTLPAFGTYTQKGGYRRVGSKLEAYWEINQTVGGAVGAGVYLLSLPPGVTIDTTNLALDTGGNNGTVIGVAWFNSGSYNANAVVCAYDATRILLKLLQANGSAYTTGGYWSNGYIPIGGVFSLGLSFSVPIAQWAGGGIVALADSLGPMFLSQTLFTTNADANGGSGSYYGADGAPINTSLTNGTSRSCDIALRRSLLPNEVPVIELYSNITKDWVQASDAQVPSLYLSGFGSRLYIDNTVQANNRFQGISIARVTPGLIRVRFSGDIIGYTSGEGTPVLSKTWANVVAAADGFTRWRVRIGAISAVELPPKIRASYFIASFTFTTALVTQLLPTTKEFDAYSAFNTANANAFTAPMAGFLRITFGMSWGSTGHTVHIFKNGVSAKILSSQVSTTTTSSIVLQVDAGDYVDLRSGTSGVTGSNVTIQFELETA